MNILSERERLLGAALVNEAREGARRIGIQFRTPLALSFSLVHVREARASGKLFSLHSTDEHGKCSASLSREIFAESKKSITDEVNFALCTGVVACDFQSNTPMKFFFIHLA
jgi:hypothetical protein